MRKRSVFMGFVCLIQFSLPGFAVTRYVTVAGAGAMDGSSWANAFPGTSLQAAINASIPGDEVWVMSGTYFTTTTANRNIWFSMLNGVGIYGSFNGTETNLSQRTFTCGFSSILSAEIGAPGIADNSYHVFNNSSLNTTSVLDGFTITGANANFDLIGNDNRSLGGGMLNNGQNGGLCTPTIRNCLFIGNSALFGGGIFDHGQNGGNASPVISNCIFMNNNATGGGGAIDNFGYSGNASPVVTNCIFYGNTATDRAGAMYCWGGGNGNASPTIVHCLFVNNSSFDGGCIVADRSNFATGNSGTANPTVRNCIFWNNTAGGTGPQFYLIGGGGFFATYTIIDNSNQNPPHNISGAGTSNIFTAPTFLNINDPNGADDCWLTADDGLQLELTSVGIDDGDNTGVAATDIRGYNRIINTITDIGPYEFNSVTLPVRWISFIGKANGNSNMLIWETADELDAMSYEIERGDDAVHFVKIGELMAGKARYQFADHSIQSSRHFYRLRQVDNDGRFSYSRVIELANDRSIPGPVVFPNPVRSVVTVLFGDNGNYNAEFILINANGQVIRKIKGYGPMLQIDMSKEISGVYRLVNIQGRTNIPFLKL